MVPFTTPDQQNSLGNCLRTHISKKRLKCDDSFVLNRPEKCQDDLKIKTREK